MLWGFWFHSSPARGPQSLLGSEDDAEMGSGSLAIFRDQCPWIVHCRGCVLFCRQEVSALFWIKGRMPAFNRNVRATFVGFKVAEPSGVQNLESPFPKWPPSQMRRSHCPNRSWSSSNSLRWAGGVFSFSRVWLSWVLSQNLVHFLSFFLFFLLLWEMVY